LLWLPYGLVCLFQPAILEGVAGVAYTSATGSTELRAMYGGIQSALGALALAAVIRPRFSRAALTSLAVVTGGLGVARLLGTLLDGGFSAYTGVGLAVEFGSLSLCLWLLTRGSQTVATESAA